MKGEKPRPLVILEPIGKAPQSSPKPGPQHQQYNRGPNGHDIETNLQQIEESFEPGQSPLERLRIESERQSEDLDHLQSKQPDPADVDQPGPRLNGSIICGGKLQSTISPLVAMPFSLHG